MEMKVMQPMLSSKMFYKLDIETLLEIDLDAKGLSSRSYHQVNSKKCRQRLKAYYATLLMPPPSSTCCLNFPHSLTATIRCLVVISYFSRQYFASGDSGVLNCGGGAGKTIFLFFSIQGVCHTYYKNCSISLAPKFLSGFGKKFTVCN